MTVSPSITPRPSISAPNDGSSDKADVPTQAGRPEPPSRQSSAPLGLPTALKPIGIVNEQNTCFLNSTFQALSATAPLISLLNASPTAPSVPSPISLLPAPVISPSRIPALIPDANEPPIYPLLPVTKTFLASLAKAWKMKDAGGGTSGSGETTTARSMRLNHLLREMARKYDQYDDYMQQDAHELLRHLLDSMEMEEKDVIKRVQPPPPPTKKGGPGNAQNKDGISPLPSPAPSAPASPTKTTFAGGLGAGSPPSATEGMAEPTPTEVPDDERLVPFVDVLFGGLLASVVVCESCKSVSHTYEGFLDISLSLKGDAPRTRKRDKLKAAFGFKSKQGNNERRQSGSDAPSNSSVMSESELSDSETRAKRQDESNRRRSMDHDDRMSFDDTSSTMTRNSSISSKLGLKAKPSFGFRKKPSRPSSSSSSSLADPDKTPPAVSIPGSPNTFARSHGSGPTPAQNAYIQRILAAPAGHHIEDPLAKLRAANAGEGLNVNNNQSTTLTGLEESLKAFTSVEVLEGDNAFACRKCWKVKTGRYQNSHATVMEEDESEVLVASPRAAPPSISIMGSDSASEVSVPAVDERRPGRANSAASRSSAATSPRAPSPLRRVMVDSRDDPDQASQKAYAASAISADSGTLAEAEDQHDGLSDSSSSDDEPPPADVPVGLRPKMPNRRKSSHFVLRRAFKRYLIAQPPEILVFHFKRFKQTTKSSLTFTSFYDLKKMDDFISFPEVFDLAPYLAPNRNDYKMVPTAQGMRAPYMDWPSADHGPVSQEPVMYRLYALVVHLGSMIGGHYIAYVLVDPEVMFKSRPEPSGVDDGADAEVADRMGDMSMDEKISESTPHALPKKDRRVWCYCSDTTIRLASLDEVLAAKAYICFYEKVPVGRN